MKLSKTIFAALIAAMAMSCAEQPKEQTVMEEKNQVIETIMARRSIRKYQDRPVSRDTLNKIMECGINAPNGQNRQSWEVRVVDNPEVMNYIKQVMIEAYDEKVVGCFRGAPVMVFIARDVNYDFSAYDCGLMAENMMLAAQSLGVGSICLGSPVRLINDNPALERVFSSWGIINSEFSFSDTFDNLY